MFKKLLLSIILIGVLASPVFGQTITENLDAMKTNLNQASYQMNAFVLLQGNYKNTVEVNIAIQKLVDEGQFDQIPLNVKQALNQAWTALKNYIATIEANQNIMEAFEWGPQDHSLPPLDVGLP